MEVLSLGPSAQNAITKEDCVLEVSGRQLFLRITLRGTWVWLYACGMDEGEQPQLIFNVGDGPQGWTTVRKFVLALERSGVKSLRTRPIQLGQVGLSSAQSAPHRATALPPPSVVRQ